MKKSVGEWKQRGALVMLFYSLPLFPFFSYFLPIYISEWMSLYSEGEAWQHIFSPPHLPISLSLTCQEKHKADIRQWQQSLSTVFYEPRRVIGVHFYNDRVIPINWEFLLSPFCYDTFIKNYKYQL